MIVEGSLEVEVSLEGIVIVEGSWAVGGSLEDIVIVEGSWEVEVRWRIS